ncbi:MAG: peptidylprolyl isomerase [Planctomycetota bacterium]
MLMNLVSLPASNALALSIAMALSGSTAALATAVAADTVTTAANTLKASTARNGLSVDRRYFQVDQPVEVRVPPIKGDNASLVILTAGNEAVVSEDIAANAGRVDIASVFPDLFKLDAVHYLQLMVDDEAVHSPLVLQPMVNRPRPIIRMEQRGPGRTPVVSGWDRVPPQQQAMAGFRIYPESNVLLKTTQGEIELAMRPDHAPNTVWNFISLVEGGFYTKIPFHRVVSQTRSGFPFVIQAGDPTGTGMGGPGYQIDLEPSTLPHDLGVISMAREGTDVDTGGSQFFICLSREGTQFLDGQYTAFASTVEGIDVVNAIAAVETDPRTNRPKDMPYINSASLAPAPPRTPIDAAGEASDDEAGGGSVEGANRSRGN